MTRGATALAGIGGPRLRLAAIAAALIALTAAGPTLHLTYGGWMLMLIFLLGGAGAYAASRTGNPTDERGSLIVILAGAVLMRLALLFVEPYLSTDIYRYVWDGRVQAAGINPYRYVPGAPELASLRDAAIFPHINRADYAVTIYPPTAQALFLAITRLGESVLTMKLGLIACEAGIVGALLALLHRLGQPLARVALYAWHPLPVWEVAGSGHVDVAMCALLVAGLLLFLQGRGLLAGVAVTLGALVKPTAVLALPVFWRPWDWRLPLVVLATLVLAYLPYLSVGSGVLGFLPHYVEEEGLTSGSGIIALSLIESFTGPIPGASVAYIALAALVLGGLAVAIGFRHDRTDRAAIVGLSWLLVTFLAVISPHYPWYYLVLVPILVIHPSAAAWAMTLGAPVIYDSVGGVGWPDYHARMWALLLASAAAVAWDLRRARAAARDGGTVSLR
jgi:hypothetical protein